MLVVSRDGIGPSRTSRGSRVKTTRDDNSFRPAVTTGKRKAPWLVAVLVLFAGLGIVAFLALDRPARGTLELKAGIALPQPRPLPEFSLQDQHGLPFTRASLDGQWTLLFAGFTSCPDICPATLATLATLDTRLDRAGRELQVLFLGLDPERDDPATMRAYLGHFNPDFRGATGETVQIDQLMAALGLAYLRVPTGAESYTIDHSTALVLIDPQARVAAYFKPPLLPDAIAADLAPVLAAR